MLVVHALGKNSLSPAKQFETERSTAMHLGMLQRIFSSGGIQEHDLENADEIHFTIDMDNGRTLSFLERKERSMLMIYLVARK